MAKKAHPWYWEKRNGWYATLHGQRHFLGEHPKDAPRPAKSKKTGQWNSPKVIDETFRKIFNRAPADGDCVAVILDDFIDWTKVKRAKVTADRYEEFCQDFIKATDKMGQKFGNLPITQLSSQHVTTWLSKKENWGPTTKRNAQTALMRGFNWAVKNRGLARNPIYGMEKDQANTRMGVITPEQFEKLLVAIPDQRFKDLLIVSFDSGGRPFEVKDLEARHIQLDKQLAFFPKEEAKGRKHSRTVYFPTERSMDIITRLCDLHFEGKLFRNRLGNPWTAQAVKCRLEDLDQVLGRRVRHYDLRHSYVTRKLFSGVDSHIVAKLSGHRDTKMLDTVYSHVADDYAFMLKQAQRDV